MNPLFARFLRSVYRKEPISGFILILGATDALIGGFGGKSSLLSIGLFIALLGIIMRWRQSVQKTPVKASKPARYLLPPSSSHEPLPLLVNNSKRQK